MFEYFLEHLVETSEGLQERAEGAAFLQVAKAAYPISNVCYVGLDIPLQVRHSRFVQCIYTDQRVKHCVSLRQITPSRLRGFSLLTAGPVDWSDLPDTPDAEALRQERLQTSGSRHILSFPLRPQTAEKAILCLAAGVQDGEWHQLKTKLLSDFQALGNYFHQHILRIYGHDTERAMLVSAREIDCLRWIAAGKTAWEASKILGISERTVRFHLNAAREKLHCITTTQAVAKAISQQLI